jgi:uncharacterized delta-60 repeat protein
LHRTPPRLEVLEDRCLLSAGALDPTFGNGGIVTTALKSGNAGGSVFIQPDHKIIVASVDSSFVMARYLENGSPDTTFGRGGIVTASITGNEEAAALQSDGKILMVGYIIQNKTQQMVLLRYNANGTLDTTFGNKGMVTTNFASGSLAHAVAIQSDGKIVLGGMSNNDFALARFNPNGTVDTSFGTNGQVTASLNGGSGWLSSIALQSDGKIVAVGYWQPVGQSLPEFAIARFTSVGALDPTFGGTGFVLDNPGSLPAVLRAVVVQSDGKIVVTGQVPSSVPGGAGDLGVLRYNSDGTPDTTFGVNGLAAIDVPNNDSDPYALALQSDGKILVGGTTVPWSQSPPGAFALARVNPDGSLDPTFGTAGEVTTAVGPPAQIDALAIQPWNGDIVAAGFATVARGTGFALARYLGDPVAAPLMLSALEPTASLVWDYGGGQSPQTARAVATDSSGNEYVAGSFSGTAVLTGANGSSATLTAPPVSGTQTAQTDVFLAKYDPSGTLLWARSMGTSWLDDAYSIAVDGAGNAYLTGELAPGSLTFGASTYSNTTNYETAFVAKYDTQGNALWLQTANNIGGTTLGGGHHRRGGW